MDVIITSPQVTYKIRRQWDKSSEYSRYQPEVFEQDWKKYTMINISNPEDLPARELYETIQEPIAKCELITPVEYIGPLMQLSQERRGVLLNQQYIDSTRVMLVYELPMNELILRFLWWIKKFIKFDMLQWIMNLQNIKKMI